VSVSAAADLATLPKDEQGEIVARGKQAILQAATQIRARQREVRHAKRIAKIVEINAGNTELATVQKFPIVLADPPWDFYLRDSDGDGKGPSQHYPTMSVEEIKNFRSRKLRRPMHCCVFGRLIVTLRKPLVF
jgi:hypothetical protein